MQFIYNDGGRKAAGYRGSTGDCAVRAIAIVTGLSYQEVYDAINRIGKTERTGKRKRGRSNARTGVYRFAMHRLFQELGWKWTSTMFIGQGCKVHMKAEELPKGRIVVSLSRHYAAVVNGVVYDTYDPSRNETRCVYGYWSQ